MDQESQNIEWKESWHDKYLEWIAGFANAQGGRLYIGKDDKGVVKGLPDAKRQLEEIPNKVRDLLGIMVEVNLHVVDGASYLEIVVESYPYPVSYKGHYHYRSGSTKQELKGAMLDKFLLGKQGRKWDGVPVPRVEVSDLSKPAFDYFRKNAARSKRLDEDALGEQNEVLLEKLHLMDGDYLKRASILLFHPEPDKFITGAYIKIGFFRTDDDLLYQNEVHGHLFHQVEQTMDLLLSKYLKAEISYQGVKRSEVYPFPEAALREALLNAVAHKDYSGGNPIQISVYADKLLFWNEGQLPENWTVERLAEKHPSMPFNPDIAQTLFRVGLIEAWGRGTIKMINECKAARVPVPQFKYDLSGFLVSFRTSARFKSGKVQGTASPSIDKRISDEWLAKILSLLPIDEVGKVDAYREILQKVNRKSLMIIQSMNGQGALARKEIMSLAGVSNQTMNVKRYLEPLILLQAVSPTIQNRPSSRLQRYILTDIGTWLAGELLKSGKADGNVR